MRVLIILSSNDPEIKCNALRFGNHLLGEGEAVCIFLNGSAIALYDGDSLEFPIAEQATRFVLNYGELAACGKCLGVHGMDAIEHVALSNMAILSTEVRKADKIISF